MLHESAKSLKDESGYCGVMSKQGWWSSDHAPSFLGRQSGSCKFVADREIGI